MTSLSWTKCSIPPYSRDVAPCDFALLQHLKHWLRGTHFDNLSHFVMMFLLQYPRNGRRTCSGSGWIGISAVWSTRDVTLMMNDFLSSTLVLSLVCHTTLLSCGNYHILSHFKLWYERSSLELRWKCSVKIYLFLTFLNRPFTINVETRAQVDYLNDTWYVFFVTSNYI